MNVYTVCKTVVYIDSKGSSVTICINVHVFIAFFYWPCVIILQCEMKNETFLVPLSLWTICPSCLLLLTESNSSLSRNVSLEKESANINSTPGHRAPLKEIL